jgi:DNA-binding GntR family transcriptional regulator
LADSSNVTALLRQEILDGVFNPGERLIELQLTERYGAGRAAIRSALGELAKEGLVVKEANRGASVRKTSAAGIIELYEAHAALESLVARSAAERAGEDEKRELQEIIQEMRKLSDQDTPAALTHLAERLHRRIREISRHGVACALLENLRDRIAQARLLAFAVPGRAGDSLADHEALAEAITQGDADSAERAVRRHLRSVVDGIRGSRRSGSRTR